jgi:uncharacterized membrane protein
MTGNRLTLTIIMAIILSGAVTAATLTGTAYTADLQIATNSILTINSTPQQRIVLDEGIYNLSITRGTYLIRVEKMSKGRAYDDELVIEIKDTSYFKNTGNYTYDFILFPSEGNTTNAQLFEFDDSETLDEPNTPKPRNWPIGIIPIVIIFILLIVLHRRKKEQRAISQKDTIKAPVEIPMDLNRILEVIHKEGGRITQRELRKHIPCSEAKLSMMLTELEVKGKIEKIKKGRGNVLVLK